MIEKNKSPEEANKQGRLMLGGIALGGTAMIGFGMAELAMNGIAAAEMVFGLSFIMLGSTALAANMINNHNMDK